MIALTPRDLARALGGDATARGCTCPGPGHSRQDRSLSVVLSRTAPDSLLVHSHARGDWREYRDHVRGLLGLTGDSAHERLHRSKLHNVQLETDPADDAERTGWRAWRIGSGPRRSCGTCWSP